MHFAFALAVRFFLCKYPNGIWLRILVVCVCVCAPAVLVIRSDLLKYHKVAHKHCARFKCDF